MNETTPTGSQVQIIARPPVWMVALLALSLLVSLASVGLIFASRENVALPTKSEVDTEALVEKVAMLEKTLKALEAGVSEKANAGDLSSTNVQVNSLSELVTKANSQLGTMNEQLSGSIGSLTEAQNNHTALLEPFRNGLVSAWGTPEAASFSVQAKQAPGTPRVDLRTLLNGDLHQPLVGGVLNDAKSYQFYLIGAPEGGRAYFSDSSSSTLAKIGADDDPANLGGAGLLQLFSGGRIFQQTKMVKDSSGTTSYMSLGLPNKEKFSAYLRASGEGGSAWFRDESNSLSAWIGTNDDTKNSANSGSVELYSGGKLFQQTEISRQNGKSSSYMNLRVPATKSWGVTMLASEDGGQAQFRDGSDLLSARIGASESGFVELYSDGNLFHKAEVAQIDGQPKSMISLRSPDADRWTLQLQATNQGGRLLACPQGGIDCVVFQPGGDVAERFPAQGDVRPGDAVSMRSIDGKVVAARSTSASDQAVLGVVSGAGNLKPAMLIGEEHANVVPVAIGGTVYARVEADSCAVKPGTLLVTSAVRGHLMCAPAQPLVGSIVGKAMESLPAGRGLIRVWISHH